MSPAMKTLASMGPRSFERGKMRAGVSEFVHVRASMGPRSFERGKSKELPMTDEFTSELQWGRVRLNAERIRPPPDAVSVRGLQWGRVRLNAESA